MGRSPGVEGPAEIPKDILLSVNQFQRKQKKGTIDVWWLYDDGGLTLLLPFILTTRNQWSNCRLRVFSLANKKDQLDRDQRNMAALLNKFRIDYSDVTVIPDVFKPPQPETKQKFNDIISRFRDPSEDSVGGEGNSLNDETAAKTVNLNATTDSMEDAFISESEFMALKDKVRITHAVQSQISSDSLSPDYDTPDKPSLETS